MNIQDLIQKFRGIFIHSKQDVPDPIIELMIRTMQKTRENECGCDDFFNGMDQFVEININGKDAAKLMPLLKDHLETCDECCEEYEALLRILEQKATT